MSAEDRREAFDKLATEVDEKALVKCVDFARHRYVSIERDKQTTNRYVKGHASMRAACDHLARTVEEGDPYVPDEIVDLDTGETHELTLIAFVAPKAIDAVGVMMPRELATQAMRQLTEFGPETAAKLLHAALQKGRPF